MVIPVSSLCCWKTEGLWCLFLLFLPSLCVIQSSSGTRVTHTLQWARSAGKTDDTLKEFNYRSTQSESVLSWRDKGVRWCWKGSYTFTMRLMGCLYLLSSNVYWRNIEYTEMTLNWIFLTLYLASCGVQLIHRSSPYSHIRRRINKYFANYFCGFFRYITWYCTKCYRLAVEVNCIRFRHKYIVDPAFFRLWKLLILGHSLTRNNLYSVCGTELLWEKTNTTLCRIKVFDFGPKGCKVPQISLNDLL